MGNELLVTKDISMDFYSGNTKTRVLHGINLNIKKGKLTMVVGPSGSGKTTLVSIITAMLTPATGTVLFNNIDIFTLSNLEKTLLRQKNIGFVFQQYNLLNTLSATENASIPLLAAKVPFKEAQRKAVRVLQTLGLEDHINKLPSQLSGGEQQRVAIARALVHDPQFIVCDEPTASLDEKNGQKILKILKKISQKSNRSVLIVTHDNRIFDYADLIIYMNDGKLIENNSRVTKK
jgi:putative ABC transport system ATP-binding protein